MIIGIPAVTCYDLRYCYCTSYDSVRLKQNTKQSGWEIEVRTVSCYVGPWDSYTAVDSLVSEDIQYRVAVLIRYSQVLVPVIANTHGICKCSAIHRGSFTHSPFVMLAP